MGFELSSLNAKYRNLSEIHYSENAWRVIRVHDPVSDAAYRAILLCWNEKFLSADHYSDLRSTLRDAYVSLRSLVGPTAAMQEQLRSIGQKLATSVEGAQNFLSDNERNLLSHATSMFDKYANSESYPLADAVLSELRDSKRKTSLVVDGPSSVPVATDFIPGLIPHSSITRVLANLYFRDQNHVVVVASPDPMRLKIEQVRRLLFGGDTVKVTFVIPSWWSLGAANRVNAELMFGLDGPNAEYVREVGEQSEAVQNGVSEIETNWDLSIPPRPISAEIEKFSNSGPVECNLLILEQKLVMPVEALATRVSVIRKSLNQEGFSLEFTSPQKAALDGDVVFSFAQVSERDFIREQADRMLGDELDGINSVQLEWKIRLQAQGSELGWLGLEKKLSEAGVSKAHRVRWWGMDPYFIRPMSDIDLEKLIAYLGFDAAFSDRVFEATRRINHARDKAGKAARLALTSAVTDEIWTNLQKGHACEISLSDFGEASFIAARAKDFDSSERLTGILQIRRILGGLES
jgi:hypothetical protein